MKPAILLTLALGPAAAVAGSSLNPNTNPQLMQYVPQQYQQAQQATAPAPQAQQYQLRNGADDLIEDPRRGWYFYLDPVKRKEIEEAATAPPTPEQVKKPSGRDCSKKAEWDPVECGFVNPGKDFEFQALQRDKLMQRFAMEASNPAAVLEYQKYQAWVTDQAIVASNVWTYNLVQNPDLDSTVSQPVSSFGLQLARQTRSSARSELFKATAAEGGTYLVFTRESCEWCENAYDIAAFSGKTAGFKTLTVDLDGKCTKAPHSCIGGEQALDLAKKLKVVRVPTVYLHVPQNTWIRLSQGVVTKDVLEARLELFLSAYRGALLESALADPAQVELDFNATLQKANGTRPAFDPIRGTNNNNNTEASK